MDELEVGIRWIQESLSVERLEVDDLEPFGASDAESRLEEVDRTRFGGDVELLLNVWIEEIARQHPKRRRRDEEGGEKGKRNEP